MIENGNKHKAYVEYLKKQKEKKEDPLIQEIKNQQIYIPKILDNIEEKNVENTNIINNRRRRNESSKNTKEKKNTYKYQISKMTQYTTLEETENIPNLLEQFNNIGKVNENNNSKKYQQYTNTNNKNHQENNNQTNLQNIDSDEYSYGSLIDNNNNNYTPIYNNNNIDDNAYIYEYVLKNLDNHNILFDFSKLLDKSVGEKLKNNLLLLLRKKTKKKDISKCK